VNDPATPMHVIESEEDLFSNLFDQMHGHTLILMSFDQTKQILAQHLENHADVYTIGSFMAEVVKERDNV